MPYTVKFWQKPFEIFDANQRMDRQWRIQYFPFLTLWGGEQLRTVRPINNEIKPFMVNDSQLSIKGGH